MADPIVGLKDWSGKFNQRDDTVAKMLAAPPPVGLGDIVRFDHLRDRWLIWNGVRWRPDLTRRIYDMTRLRLLDWIGADDGLSTEDKKHLLPMLDYNKKMSALRSLGSMAGIAMEGNEWDTDGFLVGFNNGIMDLRSGQWFAQPDPRLLVSKSVGVDWDPKATCPQFDAFLEDIFKDPGGKPQPDLVAYMRRLIGYSLIGTQKEQKFWLWVGRGANGKGVLARTLSDVFGEYADTPIDTLYMKTRAGAAPAAAARPDLMRLQAIRFTHMSEPPGGQFAEELLKAHTGDDTVLARDLYAKAGQMARFRPTHKINFLTNDPPKTDDVGIAMARRVRVIRFEQQYEANPDRDLEDRLKTEKQGILNLAIREALAYLKDGLPEPAVVTKWSAEYISENDPLGKFIAARCITGRGEQGRAHALWEAYSDWAAQEGIENPMSMTGLGLALGRKFTHRRLNYGVVYSGIRALSAVELAERET